MRCTNCDRQLQPGVRFCGHCGQPVPSAPPTQTLAGQGGSYPPSPPVPGNNWQNSLQGKGNNNLLYGIIALLVAAIAIAGVFVLYTASKDDDSSQANVSQRTDNSKKTDRNTPGQKDSRDAPTQKTDSDDVNTKKKTNPEKVKTPVVSDPAPNPVPEGRTRSLGAFQTASGNIHCVVNDYLRCDISQNDAAIPPKPADCDLDYGNAFQMEFAAGGGERICAGDTVNNPNNPVLAYGDKNVVGAFTCESTKASLICTTDSGGYMKLSRQSQTLHGAQ